ncbi:MAG: hypothetical protein KGJ60_14770 [Verrucomicrobiota bacterium]|nr:hypothetical protein [Verrucomicrobiota bacterium]
MKALIAFLSLALPACLLAGGAERGAAAHPATNAPPKLPKSVFTLPTTPAEGRDPFFPNSLRPYQAVTSHAVALSSLVIMGILGTPEHPLVIINNLTFGVGDVEQITTPGGPVQVHCIAINGNTVLVEANGRRESLLFHPETEIKP